MAGPDDTSDAGRYDETPAGEPPPPHWGLGDAAIGFAIGFVATSVAAGVALAQTGEESTDDLSLVTHALLQLPLWVGFLGWPLLVSGRKGNGPVADFGLRARPKVAGSGFLVGVFAQAILVPLLYVPIFWLFDSIDSSDVEAEARDLTDRATGVGVLVLILIVVIGAPIAEEVFFRGLVLRSLLRWMPSWVAVLVSSSLFALAHFQGIQLPALFLFGVVTGTLAVRTQGLVASIFAHAGFNAWTVFVLLVEPFG